MTKEADTVLSRPLKVEEIRDGASEESVASRAEMEAIARMLDLVALDGLALNYRIDRGGGGRLHLTGTLHADVTQTCVVTLEPVAVRLDVPVEVEFWPASLVEEFERSAEEQGSLGILDWPEAIVDGKIDLGPVIYESLATGLDPYPKREGASFDWSQGQPEEPAKTGPFAALAALKRR
jgi:uncharacterized metal-binding protein YceD (DUF177 family)